jgi:hypothetical protein
MSISSSGQDIDVSASTFFERVSPGIIRFKKDQHSTTTKIITIFFVFSVVGIFVGVIAVSDSPAKWLALAFLAFIVFFLFIYVEISIDLEQRQVIKRRLAFHWIPFWISRRRVTDSDEIAIRVAKFSEEHNGPYTHQVAIVCGRFRWIIVSPSVCSREPVAEIEQLGQWIARMLRINYRGYTSKWQLFWW